MNAKQVINENQKKRERKVNESDWLSEWAPDMRRTKQWINGKTRSERLSETIKSGGN